MTKPAIDAPGVIAFPPLIFLVSALIGGGSHCLFPMPLPPVLPWRLVGGLFALAAASLALAARNQMITAGTNIRPDKPATAIVTGGPYRFTRNPMYLALCLLHLGIGFMLRDFVPVGLTLVLAAVFQAGVIVREERYLEAKFGEVYTSYRRRVRRWL
ncbi:MAG: methyltransferase family protein [Opitutales bacterium]